MHGGLLHIAGNMIFFRAFGPGIEDAMGRMRYAVFYLLGGLAAAIAQIAVDPNSTVPSLGASGAIAAVMGAFLVTYPTDRIRTIVILGFFFDVAPIRAAILIGLWFLLQVISEFGMVGVSTGGVAYMAHIGGFAFGALAGRAFEREPVVNETF
jgi:membrane associated rhomboid family serine protease